MNKGRAGQGRESRAGRAGLAEQAGQGRLKLTDREQESCLLNTVVRKCMKKEFFTVNKTVREGDINCVSCCTLYSPLWSRALPCQQLLPPTRYQLVQFKIVFHDIFIDFSNCAWNFKQNARKRETEAYKINLNMPLCWFQSLLLFYLLFHFSSCFSSSSSSFFNAASVLCACCCVLLARLQYVNKLRSS